MSRNWLATTTFFILSMFLIGAWGMWCLPQSARVAIHFDLSGAPDQWANAWPGLFILPAVTIFIAFLLSILPLTGARGSALRGSQAYETIALAVIVVMALTQFLLVAFAFGFVANAVRFLTALMGGTIVVLGNVLGKVRRNMWVGIRIPWTLADEDNWDKTNRYAGRLMVIVGATLFVAAFALPELYGVGAILLAAGIITILPIIRSYRLSREQPP